MIKESTRLKEVVSYFVKTPVGFERSMNMLNAETDALSVWIYEHIEALGVGLGRRYSVAKVENFALSLHLQFSFEPILLC